MFLLKQNIFVTNPRMVLKNVWMQRTTQRRIKLLDLSVAGSLVKEILVPDVTLSVDKTKLIARLVLRQKGKIYWPIFQLAELVELVFFRASTMVPRMQLFPRYEFQKVAATIF